MPARETPFRSSDGRDVAATLHLPAGAPSAGAVLAQRADGAGRGIAEELTNRGIACLRFDDPDIVAAAERLAKESLAPALLIGHGAGGTAVLGAADRIPGVKAVVTIAARYDQTLGDRIEQLRRPLLVMHAVLDQEAGIENAQKIFRRARHPKSFVSLDEADHQLTREEDARFAAGVIAAWAMHYIAPGRQLDASGRRVEVAETGAGRFQQSVAVGPHHLVADEPVAVGGRDTGPSPYDLLLAALGACTTMTLRLYARRKALPLEHVAVELRHSRVHAADNAAVCEGKPCALEQIERVITLEGTLTPEQRRRLLEIADKCPVHGTLERPLRIVTSERK